MKPFFDHEKLHVYQASLAFIRWVTPLLEKVSMNRRICRQVLDCGDGVCEVTALALAALQTPKLAADTATPTQSGDSEDSVAAVQDARAPTCFALGSWSRCAVQLTEQEIVPGKEILQSVVSMLVGLIKSNSPDRLHEEPTEYRVRTAG